MQKQVQKGSKVRINTARTSDELRKKVADLGEVTGEVGDMSGIGVCTVLLPPGVKIPGHSQPLGADDRHYIDLHRDHLQLVA